MKLISAIVLAGLLTGLADRADGQAIILQEFIYETGPYPSVHASTIAETPSHELLAAWFGGTRERNPDVGIWVSRREKNGWTTSVEVANGVQADGTRHPTWNPVLFQPRNGALMLFYKVGPSPEEWWGMVRTSSDGGRTWSEARRLPDGILGPIKNKPVQLADGTILSPVSTESHCVRWGPPSEPARISRLHSRRTVAPSSGLRFGTTRVPWTSFSNRISRLVISASGSSLPASSGGGGASTGRASGERASGGRASAGAGRASASGATGTAASTVGAATCFLQPGTAMKIAKRIRRIRQCPKDFTLTSAPAERPPVQLTR